MYKFDSALSQTYLTHGQQGRIQKQMVVYMHTWKIKLKKSRWLKILLFKGPTVSFMVKRIFFLSRAYSNSRRKNSLEEKKSSLLSTNYIPVLELGLLYGSLYFSLSIHFVVAIRFIIHRNLQRLRRLYGC